jgi:hypothetical protein
LEIEKKLYDKLVGSTTKEEWEKKVKKAVKK